MMGTTRAVLVTAKAAFGSPHEGRAASAWWQVVRESLVAALAHVGRERVRAISVSAPSGTVLALVAVGKALLQTYKNGDRCEDKGALDRIAHSVPDWSPARGSTGGLAYAILLQAQDPARIGHKADRMHHHLTWGWVGDYSSALKTGYDPLTGRWPDWLEDAGLDRARLHHVVPAVSLVGILADLSVARLEDVCRTAGTLPDFILPAFATGI